MLNRGQGVGSVSLDAQVSGAVQPISQIAFASRLTAACGTTFVVNRLSVEEFFGEAALLTGEERIASVIATTRTTLYEVTKDIIAPLVEREPDIFADISKALAQRKVFRKNNNTLLIKATVIWAQINRAVKMKNGSSV